MDKRLLALAPEAMKYIRATVLWQWIGLLSSIVLVWALAGALGNLVAGAAVAYGRTIGLCALALVLRVASVKMANKESFNASRDVKRVMREKIYEKLLRLGPGYANDVPTAEVVQVSVEGCEQLETYFGRYLPQLFYAVLAPVTLFFVILPIYWLAALVLLICVPLIPVVMMAIQTFAKRLMKQYWTDYADMGDTFLENLQGLTTLKIYEADEERHQVMNEKSETFRKITMSVLHMQLNSSIVMDVVALGGAAAGIGVALHALSLGTIDLTGFLIIALLSADFFVPMRQLGSYFHVAMNGMAASKKIFRILDLPEPEEKKLLVQPGATLSLDGVSFSYEEGREVLHDVSLNVPAAGLVAIVGGSGSGKSTIASLIAGAHDDYSGSIRLGAAEVRDIDRESLSGAITSVGIGSYLFSGTVRDNLLLAKPDATEDQMWQVLDQAALAGFLRTEDGLDTRLETEGSNLSGGQRQRLALARALLHETPLYVFDEATSNIDVESEEAVMAAIAQLSRSHAVILISHRLANVVDADDICVLDAGRKVGEGTHDQLLESCAAYRQLWESQQELESWRGGAHHE